MQNGWINIVRASLAGVISWRALSPNGRQRVLQVLREVAEGLGPGTKAASTSGMLTAVMMPSTKPPTPSNLEQLGM